MLGHSQNILGLVQNTHLSRKLVQKVFMKNGTGSGKTSQEAWVESPVLKEREKAFISCAKAKAK